MRDINVLSGIAGVVGSIIGYLYGEWSELLSLLLFVVATDYITGWIASAYEGKKGKGLGLSSRIGFKGIAKKVFIFILVGMAYKVDMVTGSEGAIQTAVIYFYVANEGLSIIENAGRLNLPVPRVLVDVVGVLKVKSGKEEEEEKELERLKEEVENKKTL